MAKLKVAVACTHACQTGCGRSYDMLTVAVADGSPGFWCIPCFIAFAHQVATAVMEPDNPAVQEVVEANPIGEPEYVKPTAEWTATRGFSDPDPDDEFDIVEVVGE